ncbi:alpha/beta hydrolase [Mesorhizobium australicum]|uniref:Esterase/lipase n=1 Tax=Mesorhizobium australicum TaxID=536018 RepID=A0A1X7PFN1_9HYPH|nr:alpha/beta fold hydrolase [Mesorhizobium australicum]SMH49525.1 Esterase/lipase [Mesorhizobium australicum]
MGRIVAILLLLLVAALGALYLLGPRVATDTTLTFRDASIGADPDAYLAASEAKVANIRPGLAKEIVWAYPASRAKTPLSIVYIHGFSASKGEVRPLPDKVAAALGANLFFTRLAGHGQDNAAMGEASLNAWVNDTAEALAIGHAIGEKVIVVATSTGGSLAAWALAQPELAKDVVAVVLISPNFGVQASGAGLLTGPWGLQLAELLIGKERGFEPANDLQRQLWTWRYPTRATLPMAAIVKLARAQSYDKVTIPALFVVSDGDKVIRPDEAKAVAAAWGGPHELVAVDDPGDPSSHVLAGDAFSPKMTDPLAARIVEWIKSLGLGT